MYWPGDCNQEFGIKRLLLTVNHGGYCYGKGCYLESWSFGASGVSGYCFHIAGRAPSYILILIKYESLFMEDGAPCHTLKTHKIGCIKMWLSQLADMNPSEHLWAILDRKLWKPIRKHVCGVCFLDILLLQFMLAHYWNANDVDKGTFKRKQYKQK